MRLSDIIKQLVAEHNLPLKWANGVNDNDHSIVFSTRMYKDYDHYDWRLMWKLDPGIEINDDTNEIAIFNCEFNCELGRDGNVKTWNAADPNAISEFTKALETYFPNFPEGLGGRYTIPGA